MDAVLLNTTLNSVVNVKYFLREVVVLSERDYNNLSDEFSDRANDLGKGKTYFLIS